MGGGLCEKSYSQENNAQEKDQKVILEDGIAAVVNGDVISSGELEERLNLILTMNSRYLKDADKNDRLKILRNEVIEQLIEETILLQEAKKQGVTVTNEELESYRNQILISKLLSSNIDSKITVSDDEVFSYYNDNKNLFVEPDMVKISEVFLMVKPGSKVEDWQSAQKTMDDLYQKIKGSSDFLLAAKGLNADVSIGKSEFLKRGELPPEVEETAYSISVGELSPVIKSPIGFHIIKVDDKKPSKQRDFEEVRAYIKGIIVKKAQRKRYEEWITKLKADSKIEKRQVKGSPE